MKKNLLVVMLLSITAICSAQWNELVVPTDYDLHDVDFFNDDYGVVVGDTGTVLLTVDGGDTWTDINGGVIHGNVHSVKVLAVSVIAISTWDSMSASGEIHLTTDGGANWENVLNPIEMNHRVELGSNDGSTLFSAAKDLEVSPDMGETWETLVSNIGGMTALDQFDFANDQVAHLSGLISGFGGYSAFFHRTADGGETWFAGDAVLFPNSDALSTVCFTDPDTAYVFTNQYQNWIPSDVNGLVKIYEFNKYTPFPGSDTLWAFASEIVNSEMPAYMNDAHFTSFTEGYAMSEDGNIYKTADAGESWESDFDGSEALKAASFTENTAYAAGTNGTVVKMAVSSGVNEIAITGMTVFPNPASDKIQFVNPESESGTVKIYDLKGSLVLENQVKSGLQTIDVTSFEKGVYSLTLNLESGNVLRSKFVKQ